MLPFRCRNILIVEDDPPTREVFQEVLETAGYTVETAADGEQALEILRKIHAPCLIMLDLMMPRMNGWQFMEIQKRDVALAPIPVLVVSAAGDKVAKTDATRFMRKPVDINVLLATVAAYCGQP